MKALNSLESRLFLTIFGVAITSSILGISIETGMTVYKAKASARKSIHLLSHQIVDIDFADLVSSTELKRVRSVVPNTIAISRGPYLIRIFDYSHSLIYQNQEGLEFLDSVYKKNEFSEPISAESKGREYYVVQSSYKLLSGEDRMLQIALPVPLVADTLYKNLGLILSMIGLLFISAWFASKFMAKRLLIPVQRISDHLESLEKKEPKQWSVLPQQAGGPILGTLVEVTNHLIMRIQTSCASNQALSRSIAHELRTPLTMMLGELETISPTADLDDYKSLVSRFADDIEKMERMVSSILEVVHHYRKLSNLIPKPVCLESELRLFRESFLKIYRTEIRIPYFSQSMNPLLVDIDLFRILLDNLFRNSATHGGPSVVIEVSYELVDAEHLILTVADNGIGMPPAVVEALQNGLYTPEMGIGLNLCREICHLTGWGLKVEHNVEGGSTIHIELPLSRAFASSAEQQNDSLVTFRSSVGHNPRATI